MSESQQPTQQVQNPTLTVDLTLQEVNVIIASLQELPFKVADPVLRALVPQAEQQLKDFQVQQQEDQQSPA
jgi:hypothetical protein